MRLQCNMSQVGGPFRLDREVMGLGGVERGEHLDFSKAYLDVLRQRIEPPVAHRRLLASNLRDM